MKLSMNCILSFIGLLSILTSSCRTTRDSELKDLRITDPNGNTFEIDDERLSVEIFSGGYSGRIFFEGSTSEEGKFIFKKKISENEFASEEVVATNFLYNNSRTIDNNFTCRIGYGFNQIDGSSVTDEREITCYHPEPKSPSEFYTNILVENTIGRSKSHEKMKLCYQDDSCDAEINWAGQAPQINLSVSYQNFPVADSSKQDHAVFVTPAGQVLVYQALNIAIGGISDETAAQSAVLCMLGDVGMADMNSGFKLPDYGCIVAVENQPLWEIIHPLSNREGLFSKLDHLLGASTLKVKYFVLPDESILSSLKLGTPFKMIRLLRETSDLEIFEETLSRN